jgi:2-hydroxychromene-2-carboxylate isomerase
VPGARIDFFYRLGSRYSYLASTQIAQLEAEILKARGGGA